jgi:cytoskeleton protein RodZ
MSETVEPGAESAGTESLSAGAMLKRARQAQGLHIAALAAAIKVSPRKLELLESDQYDKLTDATFVRALAQTVCRSLKIDAAPVLALLPKAAGNRLDQVDHGLNAPFRERPGRLVPNDWASVMSPGVWFAGVLVLAAIGIWLWPAGWLPTSKIAALSSPVVQPAAPQAVDAGASSAAAMQASSASSVASAAGPASTVAPALARQVDASTLPSNPAFPPATAETADDAAPASAELLHVHASAQSWVEVSDAQGKPLIARVIDAGETVELDGALPLKVKIGNARSTDVVFRGHPVDLGASTRDNVARLELK